MIYVAGLGPGNPHDITPAVQEALRASDVVVGYKPYFQYIEHLLAPDVQRVGTGMRRERDRAAEAFRLAEEGHTVTVISSGDAAIYGMAPLVWEMKRERGSQVEVVCLPGVSAFQKASAVLGAAVGHDVCLISLSDQLTPWETIEPRIEAAAKADFITCLYNPRSHERRWQLERCQEIFLRHRSPSTVVGYVRQAGREGEQKTITTLSALRPDDIDMFTIVVIGNSQTEAWGGAMITPRGYYPKSQEGATPRAYSSGPHEHIAQDPASIMLNTPRALCSSDAPPEAPKIGQSIMIKSFGTIMGELQERKQPLWRLWPLLHAIHTTADFDMERILYTDPEAAPRIHERISAGAFDTVVTDVSMVAAGIRKGALQRLGLEAVTYINDPRAKAMAEAEGITRAQAGIRLAAEEHPTALFAFGNAPTALIELCQLMRQGKCSPAGVIGAPVGFVNVIESKNELKEFTNVPKLIVEGRKGGSNLAATLVNACLTYDDAAALRPGRDV